MSNSSVRFSGKQACLRTADTGSSVAGPLLCERLGKLPVWFQVTAIASCASVIGVALRQPAFKRADLGSGHRMRFSYSAGSRPHISHSGTAPRCLEADCPLIALVKLRECPILADFPNFRSKRRTHKTTLIILNFRGEYPQLYSAIGSQNIVLLRQVFSPFLLAIFRFLVS